MTTQAEDLGKLLGTAIIDAADKHGTAIVAASIHIHTGLSQIAEALGGRSTRQTRQDAPGRPRMPGRKETATEPLRDAQDATQPDWATVILVHDNEQDLWGRHGSEFTLLGDVAGAGAVLAADRLKENYGPLTVILDANGNPPAEPAPTPITVVVNNAPDTPTKEPQWSDVLATAANPAAVRDLINRAETAEHRVRQLKAEPVWLDAEALNDLPTRSLAVEQGEGASPRWRNADGEWCRLGNMSGLHPEQIAPAQVLWTPKDNR